MVCDAGLHGERIGYNNTCSAFVLMLTGSVVAVMIAMQERIIGRKKEFTNKKVKKTGSTYQSYRQTTIISRLERYSNAESTMKVEKMYSFTGQPKLINEHEVNRECTYYHSQIVKTTTH